MTLPIFESGYTAALKDGSLLTLAIVTLVSE